MDDHGIACQECGASGRLGACQTLLDRLLALDHERRQPWGAFHGLNVACFLLQHPSAMPAASNDGALWQLVTAFLDEGLEGAGRIEAARVRANRRGGRPWTLLDPAPRRRRPPTTTIEDVADDGTFPAAGYEERMRAWAASIVAERTEA